MPIYVQSTPALGASCWINKFRPTRRLRSRSSSHRYQEVVWKHSCLPSNSLTTGDFLYMADSTASQIVQWLRWILAVVTRPAGYCRTCLCVFPKCSVLELTNAVGQSPVSIGTGHDDGTDACAPLPPCVHPLQSIAWCSHDHLHLGTVVFHPGYFPIQLGICWFTFQWASS